MFYECAFVGLLHICNYLYISLFLTVQLPTRVGERFINCVKPSYKIYSVLYIASKGMMGNRDTVI
jgi:hypothetical protein